MGPRHTGRDWQGERSPKSKYRRNHLLALALQTEAGRVRKGRSSERGRRAVGGRGRYRLFK